MFPLLQSYQRSEKTNLKTLHVVVEVGIGIGLLDGKIYYAEEEGVEEEEGAVVVDVIGKRITTTKRVTSIRKQTHFDDLKETRSKTLVFYLT